MHRTRFISYFTIATFALVLFSNTVAAQAAGSSTESGRMPITTSSPEARSLFDQGVIEWENLHITRALEHWQAAIGKDPNFMLAHLYISERIPDPDQQAAELKKVRDLMGSATPGEQLMAQWIIADSRGDTIAALSAMNELLGRYPKDKHLYWFAALSMGANYHQWERSAELAEQAVQVDPDFAGALNNLGYDYAFQGKFDKAFPVMQHYIEVLPGEPNPQDSYAEILRMAGHFDEAVEHYHAALKIEPNFGESLLGLADTYALMGKEDEARAQYEVAIQHAYTKAYAVMWKLKWAATYLRESRPQDADAAYQQAAAVAHSNSVGPLEAEAYRIMALYQKDEASASRWLKKALEVLDHPHDTSRNARQQELALIHRTGIHLAIQSGRLSTAGEILAQLNKMSEESHNPNIDIAYHASAGMLLVAKHKWLEAIPHLEEDTNDPFSMELLVTAYQKAGLSAKSEKMARTLSALNAPTVEQALVVPGFRSKQNKSK
ncbi:MAG TPA: tetratricopeptide repeat protein [Candidatus Angelobacter sp.]|jgi:tetratricopeptide (TPR) repeat protein|nr:tetratricopeptide repeat protein [Candidatus Angelobacter sp.]